MKNRFLELEGLRAVAAISVVFYHFFLAFYAYSFFGPASDSVVTQNNFLEDNLYGNPIMAVVSGTFAVAVFFVLSGFVLSIGYFQSHKIESIKKMAAKRYPRLMLPALASILMCFFVLVLGLSHIQEVAHISKSGWLAGTWTFEPNILSALWDGLIGIFSSSGNAYNNVLWTMNIEFVGSFIVFGFLIIFGNAKNRPIAYALLLLFSYNTWFMAFVIGMIMADLYANGKLGSRNLGLSTIFLLVIGVFLGGYPVGGASNTIYSFFTIPDAHVNWVAIYPTVGASILIFVILTTKKVGQIFSGRLLSSLGKYTFSLYLVHLVVLYTFTTLVFLLLRNSIGLGYNTAVMVSIISSIPVVALVTWLFEKYIDAPSIKIASTIGEIIYGRKELRIDKYLTLQRKKMTELTNRWRKSVSMSQENVE